LLLRFRKVYASFHLDAFIDKILTAKFNERSIAVKDGWRLGIGDWRLRNL